MSITAVLTRRHRWHEHDADEMMETCDACIDGAIEELKSEGWTKESVKVIGRNNVQFDLRHILMILSRCHEST